MAGIFAASLERWLRCDCSDCDGHKYAEQLSSRHNSRRGSYDEQSWFRQCGGPCFFITNCVAGWKHPLDCDQGQSLSTGTRQFPADGPLVLPSLVAPPRAVFANLFLKEIEKCSASNSLVLP